jgi:hypothetical protein
MSGSGSLEKSSLVVVDATLAVPFVSAGVRLEQAAYAEHRDARD